MQQPDTKVGIKIEKSIADGSKITIAEGIKIIKESREKLTRLIKIQKDNFTLNVPVDCKNVQDALANNPKLISFVNLEKQINQVSDEIAFMRERVDETAHKTTILVDGHSMTLSMLRLHVETLRSDVDRVTKIKTRDFHVRLTVEDKEREMDQLDDMEIEAILVEKKGRKRHLEAILEKVNVNTEILL